MTPLPLDLLPDQNSRSSSLNWAHLGGLILVTGWAALALQAQWSSVTLLVGGLLLILSWLACWEWLYPHRKDWQAQRADRKRDVAFLLAVLVTDALGDGLIRALLLTLSPDSDSLFSRLPLCFAAPAAVLLGSFGDYWMHRLSHRGGWLWRVHFIHHRPSSLNVTNNFTTHPIDLLLRKSVQVLPLWLVGFEPMAIALALLFMQVQSFATHANTRGTLGWLNYLIGSAELHRWHHSIKVAEAGNFGAALPLWDQLFGTFRLGSDSLIEPNSVGVRATTEQPSEHEIKGLFIYPLKPIAALRCCKAPA